MSWTVVAKHATEFQVPKKYEPTSSTPGQLTWVLTLLNPAKRILPPTKNMNLNDINEQKHPRDDPGPDLY